MSPIRLVLASILLVASGPSAAALEAPTGPVVLTVSGAITETNGPGIAEFDMAMLNALQQKTSTLATPWTEGEPTFSGPLGRALLDAVGATGRTMVVTALNDYSADVPVEDFRIHDVILATSIDGRPLSIRDKGPIFIIYPFKEKPNLYTELYFNRSVWQIARIDVK